MDSAEPSTPPASAAAGRSAAKASRHKPHREPGFYPGEFLRQHPGVIVSIVVLLTIVFKVLVVAHGSPETVAALLQSTGAPNVAIAALLTGTRNLTALLVIWAIPQFGEAVRERDPLVVPSLTLGLSVLTVAALAPWRTLLALAAYFAVWVVTGVIWAELSKRKGRRLLGPRNVPRRLEATSAAVIGVLVAWVAIVSSDRPWLPAEQLTLHDETVVVGYVVHESDDSFAVMREPDRAVVRLDTRAVDDRSFCAVDDDDPRPITVRLLRLDRPDYPICPPD